ncbi:TolC family protein [Paracandidimonas lactea]|uniref:TolC family protein n=1 Tax=Paracandidimonas lactea TaxID=2895524 RepID=UPI001F1FB028|nr:TolC family protein [Paracandidimonas lactea]
MRSFLYLIGIISVISGPAFAQPAYDYLRDSPAVQLEPATELTLDEALNLALARSPSLSAARYLAASSEGIVTQAGVIPNPVLSFEIEDTSRRPTRTTTSTLSIPIELGGKRSARITAAELTRDVARSDLQGVRADVRSRTISAFFDVLIAQEQVALTASAVDIASGALYVATQRVAAGKVAPLEENRAQVEVANAQLEQNEAQSALKAARQRLSALWGNPSPMFTKARGDIDTLPTRPTLDDFAVALGDSPLVESARLAVERSRAQIQVERSKRYPDIELSVGVARNNELGRNQTIVGVAIPLPLFDRNQGNVYEASMLAYKSRDDYRELKTRLMVELQQAASAFDISKAAAGKLDSLVLPTANRAYETARKGFEAGKFGFTEVIDAQRTLFQARTRYLTALSDSYQALARIERILAPKTNNTYEQ